jgi:hypothetical protein
MPGAMAHADNAAAATTQPTGWAQRHKRLIKTPKSLPEKSINPPCIVKPLLLRIE